MAAAAAAPAVETPAGVTQVGNKDYEELTAKLKDISALGGISGLLGWDEMVMMPPGAADARARHKAVLAGVLYERQADPAIGALLDRLAGAPGLDTVQRAVLREAKRSYVRTRAVSKELAQRKAELESRGYQAWVAARAASDFSQFAPVLQEWVDLKHQEAAAIDPSRPAYDVALEEFEKGMTAARLDEVFSQVREGLVPLLADIRARGSPPDTACLAGTFDTGAQAALCSAIATDLGFSLERGRLDVSVHPFTGGAHPTDVRMTTRFKADDLTEGLTGAIHETGHALYEQGRNLDLDGLPVSEAMSMGIHESQSLFWERMVGLSLPFARYLAPKLAAAFPTQLAGLTAEQLYGAINVVKVPSMIRVEADEVTYPLHIILRYELERGLMDGSIKVADLPRLWNERMTAYLGCTPESDARGVLQDVHFSAGLFGYFPTYSLGAMYACQIYEEAKRQLPGLEDDIAAGKFTRLREWLNEKIHRVGSLPASGDELMVQVTGAPLDPAIFLSYLREKYTKLYKL